MADIDYKYKFREKLAEFNNEDYKIADSFLPKYLNITKPTWEKYKNLRIKSSKDIPAGIIIKAASFFECEPKELYAELPDFMKMTNDFNEFRSTYFPDYVFSRKFTD